MNVEWTCEDEHDEQQKCMNDINKIILSGI